MSYERILVVDDDKEIAQYVQHCLNKESFTVSVAYNPKEALKIFAQHHFDLVVLDIMMPEMDGLELLTRLRRGTDIPVIFLSARGDEPDKIIGLGLGADDYITKPFSAGELVARVKAHLRRYSRTASPSVDILEYGSLVINRTARQVQLDEESIELTKREFDILSFLGAHPGQVFSFQQIYEQVWEEEFLGNSNVVMVHVRRIRDKLRDNPKNPRYLATVWGIGYKFVGKAGA